jgi:putative transcriptional regulator
MEKGISISKGKVLLAQPFMTDPHFRRSVILLVEHNEESSLGFILNKPLRINVNELIAEFPEIESEVFYGGPVATDTIHYVHKKGDILDDSRMVSPGLYWGGDFEKLKMLIEEGMILPGEIRFLVGYSGWSPGQLDDEMEFGSWVDAPMERRYLFRSNPNELWQDVMKDLGEQYSVIAQMPEANLN